MKKAGETGSEIERRLWRMKRDEGSRLNKRCKRQRSITPIEPNGSASDSVAARRLSRMVVQAAAQQRVVELAGRGRGAF